MGQIKKHFNETKKMASDNESFEALVLSGLDYIEASINKMIEDPRSSMIEFANGLELLLKARLFKEYCSVVANHPHEICFDDEKVNKIKQLDNSCLCSAVSVISNDSFNQEEEIFGAIFKDKIQATCQFYETDSKLIIKNQLIAWNCLYYLLTVKWGSIFEKFNDRIEDLDIKRANAFNILVSNHYLFV